MIDIAVLRAMVANGATVEMILAVIEADQKTHSDTLTKRRATDAARQQRHRQRGLSRESRDPLTASVTPPISNTPLREIDSKKNLSLPAGWIPDSDDRDFARSKGWTEDRIDSEAQRFRDHAKATGRLQRDWKAAWRNWVTSPYQMKGNSNGHTAEPRKFSREWQREEAARVMETLKNYQGGGDGADPSIVGWLSDRTGDGG